MAVGGAAGDNGQGRGGRSGGLFGGSVSGVGLGGANQQGLAWSNNVGASATLLGGDYAGSTATVQGGWTKGSTQSNGNGGSSGNGNGGNGATGGNTSDARLKNYFNDATSQAYLNQYYQTAKALKAAGKTISSSGIPGRYKGAVDAMLADDARQASQPGNTGQAAQQAAQQAQQAAQQQQQAAEAARQAEIARQAEVARQQRISAENTQRQSLQQQLGQTDSVDATRALLSKISGLGSEADNAAALNKSLLDAANARLGQQTEAAKNSAIGSAQAVQQAATGSTTVGPNTALYSSKISQAIGSQISQADQQANAAEAARMGGYSDTSTLGKIGNVAKAALGGLGAAGPVGGLLGSAAAVYSNFVSDRQSASSRAITEGTAAPKAGIGDVLAGMAKGGLSGLAAGPLGGLIGLVAGGMTASGTAPTAEDLKGINPLNNGVTADPGSYGPGQTLVNGQRVGQGNQNTYKPGSLGSIFTPGNGYNPNPVANTPLGGSGGTTTPGTGSGGNGSNIDNGNKAGQSAFSSFIDDLRKRQMNNLLYTNAGWNGTSGTSLLGRVSGAQGAVGGLTGQIISQYGGGRSLLGGAWSF
ncbi:hypothetical protein [Pantoea dispersa]|uniref:hypothetical protein n=1 Tax=Pantoea dispersa TaxID=59814 RepID=UPI0028650B55|nr:hypothetical protein [Pantoea dispersa]MDR6297763.1 hypothetical protein [Pantoea dispersa]